MPQLPDTKHERFCQEYLVDMNQTQAFIRAGYAKNSAHSNATRLMAKNTIQARIKELISEQSARLEAEADKVFKRWWDTAHADPNEVVQHRRGACRHCHGTDHEYQWRTTREFLKACRKWEAERPSTDAPDAARALHDNRKPDDLGGYGYRATEAPDPDCPECDGLGFGWVYVPDTRELSEAGRLLYEGVKETKDGIQVTISDRAKALENVARRLNMFKGEVVVTPSDALTDLIGQINRQGSASPIKGDGA